MANRVTSGGRNDLSGRKIGRLLVKEYDQITGKWLCLCDCGKNALVFGAQLTRVKYTKSCGCYRSEKTAETNHKYKKYKGTLAAQLSIYHEYARRAKRIEREFALTKEDVLRLICEKCYYCDSIGTNTKHISRTNETYYYNGLDRIDSTKGYTLDNVVPCCAQCNRSKGILTTKEFIEWIQRASKKVGTGG